MLTIDAQPPIPDLPQFSQDMERFLSDAVTQRQARRPVPARVYWAAAGAAAAIAVTAVLAVTVGGGASRQQSPPSIQLATFSVSTVPGGQVRLSLTPGQLQDPAALRQALANAGVPALVTANSVCYVPGPTALLTQVLSPPQAQPQPNGARVWLITPSAIPNGSELSIGYYHVTGGFGIHITLIPTHGQLTCTATPPAPPHN